jgi:caffeoyl-CoA O-methyltransferase
MSKSVELTPKLYDYLIDHRSEKDPLLRELRELTRTLPRSTMQVAPEQGAFMSLLTRAIGARTAIEVGTFTGYSGLCIARGLSADGRLLTCDVNPETTAIARRFWERAGVAHKIELRLGPALHTLSLLPPGPQFDLAFIDADKANYRAYYEQIVPRVRSGGLILIDNVLWSGHVVDPSVDDVDTHAIRELNDHVARDPRVESVMLPVADGLTVCRVRLPKEEEAEPA